MDTLSKVGKETIFFDGVCNLCNGAINFIIDRDKKHLFKFASLQSAAARKHLSLENKGLDSIVLLTSSGTILTKSDAALEIAKQLGGGWRLLYAFKIIPGIFRDWVYDVIAANRYKWFGKRDTCRIPTPELKERFLEAS